jgi:hypothetical protein
MLFQMSPDGAREEGVEANSVDYVMSYCLDFEALGPSGPGSIRGFQTPDGFHFGLLKWQ